VIGFAKSCQRNLPTFREFNGSVDAFGGPALTQNFVLRRFADCTAAREPAVEIGGYPDTIDAWGHAMLINVALWLILAALIVLIPTGCIMTRPKSRRSPPAVH
jgi:hypothetical protein